jgi:serine/threonine protein kinase
MPTFDSLTGKLSPQSILIKRYLITRLAGRGGMSAIYQALDLNENRRPVAIKEMSQENLDDEERSDALARFQQEALLLKRLNHPNLPRIYDHFNSGGRSFLVMDFINGKTLLQLLHDTGKPLAVHQVIHYAEQLCDVLAYLHAQNPPVVFRDLKPTNVMVTQDGHVYLIDFGIARLFKEGQDQDTTVLGSPGYAPPEQHGSGQTSPRSDLYALGATLHCCLTNRDPYHAAERFTFLPMRQFNSLVPAELDQLVMRLLELDENKRPASALEVKQALARVRQQSRQQSSAHIPAVIPASPPSPAPSQRVQPAPPAPPPPVYQPTQVAPSRQEPQGPMILRSTPVPPVPPAGLPPAYSAYPGYPAPGYSQRPPIQPGPETPAAQNTRVWTPGFLAIFFLLLLLTIAGSYFAFSINNPYANNPQAGLDHAIEAGLAVLALIISFTMIAMTRSFIAVLIILFNAATILVTSFAFLLQTLRDVQPSAQIFTQLGAPELNQFITYGLLAAAIISLLWLFRGPFTWGDRCWIFLFAAGIGACAYLQFPYLDNDPQNGLTKHLLLLAALIILIQSTLMTGQMERKRKQF